MGNKFSEESDKSDNFLLRRLHQKFNWNVIVLMQGKNAVI